MFEGMWLLPSITKQRMGRYTYLYESTSFWDSESKYPDNHKKIVGRIDPDTGEECFTQEYLDRLKREGRPTGDMKVWRDQRKSPTLRPGLPETDSIVLAREILGTVKNFGLSYFLQSITENIGLVEILRQTLPKHWQKIVVLACYLVAENKTTSYCSDWMDENECLDAGNMASQRISELFNAFGYNERAAFYKRWYQRVREKEFVALDITSVSSYSEQIDMLEWGYNRDGEDLRQINICMLFGEISMMPVYQTIYSGSLNDVTTLNTTLNEFEAITGTRDIMLVMDKGFYKVKNINKMLGAGELSPYKFLIPVSFTSNFAKEHVENERECIDDVDNVIFTRDDTMPVRGVHRLCSWNKNSKVHAHIFYDPGHALNVRNDLYSYVAKLKMSALAGDNDPKLQAGFHEYLMINKPEGANIPASVEIRKDAITKTMGNSSWVVLISNQIEDPQKAYDLYRAKDVVEKSFYQYKNNLGLDRLRVHNDERAQNKIFIAFMALIVSSHIHKVMRDKDLDGKFTFGKLLSALSKLKIAYINQIPVLQPLTKEQKLIFKSFGIKYPDGSERED